MTTTHVYSPTISLEATIGGTRHTIELSPEFVMNHGAHIHHNTQPRLARHGRKPRSRASMPLPQVNGSEVESPMRGVVTHVAVEPGQRVTQGEPIAIIEAMKMENMIAAPVDGVVGEVLIDLGASVEPGVTLVELKA